MCLRPSSASFALSFSLCLTSFPSVLRLFLLSSISGFLRTGRQTSLGCRWGCIEPRAACHVVFLPLLVFVALRNDTSQGRLCETLIYPNLQASKHQKCSSRTRYSPATARQLNQELSEASWFTWACAGVQAECSCEVEGGGQTGRRYLNPAGEPCGRAGSLDLREAAAGSCSSSCCCLGSSRRRRRGAQSRHERERRNHPLTTALHLHNVLPGANSVCSCGNKADRISAFVGGPIQD